MRTRTTRNWCPARQLEKEQRDLAVQQAQLAKARDQRPGLWRRRIVADRLAEVGRASTGTPVVSSRPRTARASAVTVTRRYRRGSPATAKARAAARRDDIREVRDQIALVRDAERDREGAETALGRARLLENREPACRDAGERLDRARADVAEELRRWAGRWIRDGPYAAITADQAEDALRARWTRSASRTHRASSRCSGRSPRSGDRTDRPAASGSSARGTELGQTQASAAGEREAIAGERDDGPPASDLRPADRAERRGAPLWRLADFRPSGGRPHGRCD